MAKFVKKIGSRQYYEINGIRAAGLIPFYVVNNKVMILINLEYRNNELVNNIIGGKVEKNDKTYLDTMIREFNEETGFLVSDKIRLLKSKIILNESKLFFKKSKYMMGLLNIDNKEEWKILPELYTKIFNNVNKFNDRDSEELKWVNLFEFNDKKSYLLTLILNKLKSLQIFKKYNPVKEILFVE